MSATSLRFMTARPMSMPFLLSIGFAALALDDAWISLRYLVLGLTYYTPLEHLYRWMPFCLAVEAALLCRFRSGASTALWFLTPLWLLAGAYDLYDDGPTNTAVAELLVSLVAAVWLFASLTSERAENETVARRLRPPVIALLLFELIFLSEISALERYPYQLGVFSAVFIGIAAWELMTSVRPPRRAVAA